MIVNKILTVIGVGYFEAVLKQTENVWELCSDELENL